LVGMAFGLIPDKTEDVPDKTLLRVISALSQASSIKGLVNGQVDDILSVNAEPNELLLHRIHAGKTGALFRFTTQAGGMLAGKPDWVVDLLGRYGETLGMAFQVVDDLLDIRASGDVLGKTPGKDQIQGKITFPAVYGVEGSEQMLADYVRQLHEILDELSPVMETENLRFLVQFVQERES
jgi:geranylgeranyl diphosphate synthase, type II